MPRQVPQSVLDKEAASPGKRLCYKCNTLSPFDQFNIRYSGQRLGRECKKCRSIRSLKRTDEERWRDLVSASRANARKKGLQHTITVADLDIPKRCPVFGFVLKWGTKKQRDHSPSMDRINPILGYVPGNVIVVSWLANNIRSNFIPDQLRKVADFYEVLTSTR